MRMRCAILVVSGLLAITSAKQGIRAADINAQSIAPLLKNDIVGVQVPLEEAQEFCDLRVRRMPSVTSAEEWTDEAERLRSAVLDQVVYRGKAAKWRDADVHVEWLDTIDGGEGYRIRKLRFEALPGMWIPALLYEPEELSGKTPVVLNVNGHSAEGKAYKPKQARCINQAKRGMLALNIEWVGMGQLRTPGFSHASMNQLDLCGASGLAPFYLSMKRGLDILLGLEHADADRLAVTGLSGGGWQTIFLSSLDTRVKLAVPVAGYSSFLTRTHFLKDLGDSEQTPNDLATLVDYTHLTAMMAPRPTMLTYNAADNCCFESGYALGPLLTAAHPVFCLHGRADALRSHVNYDPGTHNYEQDNRQALYGMFREFFYDGDPTFPVSEIACEDELKSADDLAVPLPESNEDFNTLAKKLAAGLPRDASTPTSESSAATWRDAARSRLADLVRAHRYDVSSEVDVAVDVDLPDGYAARLVRLSLGEEWTIPAAIASPPRPQRTVVLIADEGRANAAIEAARLLSDGCRVVAIDPFCFGESYPGRGEPRANKGWLFALTVAAVGERPLGIQASQVAAASRWVAKEFDSESVVLASIGPRTSLIGLVASALEPTAIGELRLQGSYQSLKQAIDENRSVRDQPEVFCYGLLESFDIPQLAKLSAPRPVLFK